jgi:hypothetical protein
MPTKNARPKSKPKAPPRSSVDQESGATRGFEPITIKSVDLETGATRGPDIEMVPVKKAAGGRLGYRSARQPK